MRGVVACLLVGLLVVASGAAGGAVAGPLQQDSPDGVVMQVGLEPDGNASWQVAYRYRLDDNESEQAFEDLRADIRNDTARYEERFGDRMRLTVQDAENATGREMSLLDVTVSTKRVQLPQEYGVVVYQFEWTNFAVVDGERIQAGDALAGLFLDSGTALTFTWPAGYHVASVEPAPDRTESRSVYWTGPQEFGEGEPRLELAPGTPAPPSAGTTMPPAGGDGPDRQFDGLVPGLALVVVLVLFGVGAVLAIRRRNGATAAAADADGGGLDPDLLTNEEQVRGLLEEHGGRLKQQEIAEELGWTDAKTSKVVRGLREDGEIEVVRLGRENVVALPGELDT